MKLVFKVTHDAVTSTAGPAVAAVPRNGRLALVYAWRGNHNSRNLTIGVTGIPHEPLEGQALRTTVLTDTSDVAPAVLWYQDQLWLAWQGTNGAHTVNAAVVAFAGDDSVSLTQRGFVDQGRLAGGSTCAPLLVGSPYISWLGLHTVDSQGMPVESANSPVGSGWGSAQPMNWAAGSVGAVADVAWGTDTFVHAWTRKSDGRLAFLFSGEESYSAVSAQSSVFAPSLAVFQGTPYIAWVGTDGGDKLNLARVDPGSSDPIVDKLSLADSSIASPALVDATEQNYGPPRLGLAWTGTDGGTEGRLNVATFE
jgi:hypothetical protein